ncbi:hypothetical protein ACHAXH_006930 [Discostella pseudostelligera]
MISCNICNGESCFLIPSIASPRHFCMLHYYTTGAYRSNNHSKSKTASTTTGIATKKKSSSLLVDCHRMEKQLPKVQELFAEAFIELQKDIGEESARAFHSVATAEDPLAILLGSTAPSYDAKISRPLHKPYKGSYNNQIPPKRKAANYDLEGGFIRETVLPERLRKLQNPPKYEGFASANSNNVSKAAYNKKRPASKVDATATQQKPTNPYQRKPPTNIWSQIVDSNDGIHRNE